MKTSQKIWILLGACTLLLRWIAAARPDWTERFYSRGLFVAIRNATLITVTTGTIPAGTIVLQTGKITAIGANVAKAARWLSE